MLGWYPPTKDTTPAEWAVIFWLIVLALGGLAIGFVWKAYTLSGQSPPNPWSAWCLQRGLYCAGALGVLMAARRIANRLWG